jgi:hypothetical protein
MKAMVAVTAIAACTRQLKMEAKKFARGTQGNLQVPSTEVLVIHNFTIIQTSRGALNILCVYLQFCIRITSSRFCRYTRRVSGLSSTCSIGIILGASRRNPVLEITTPG